MISPLIAPHSLTRAQPVNVFIGLRRFDFALSIADAVLHKRIPVADLDILPHDGDLADCLVIIPAFDEERTLTGVLTALHALDAGLDVLVVDDGSSDATAEIDRQCGALVVSHPFNLGYGAALQTGYLFAARGPYRFLVQMDADGQHAAGDVPRLLAALRGGGADVALGSRFAAQGEFHMSAVRRLGRACLQFLLAVCGGPRVADPTTGFQAYARPVFELCCGEFYPTDFPDIDVILTLHRRGFRIVEVPVRMAPNPPSRVPMHAGLRVLYYTYKMLLATLRSALSPRQRRDPADVGEKR